MEKIILLFIVLSLVSCKKEIFVAYGDGLTDWSTETHTESAETNYDIVFNQTKVNRLDLVFTPSEWNDMQEDLDDVLSSGGSSGGPGGGGQVFSDQTPQYFECQLFFNDIEWYYVGARYKGNSSLTANNNKLPLRLKFDEFEDDHAEITNQTFYGFKELSLGSNFNDVAVMRDKSANDIFRSFGVPAVQTAFYEIWIDQGSGTSQYYGVYTMNEVVFDSFLADYFGSNAGNCYKPDGDGATFSTSGFDLDDFELKNNPGADKAEIIELYEKLHASTRQSNSDQWRSDLESVFDVDGFMKYLAANNTIQNWDTYGNMTHNYYLYHDPADGLLKWIVWDNNEAFQAGAGSRSALSFSMSEIGSDWPLISYLMDEPEYVALYKSYLSLFITSSFQYNRMNGIYSAQESLLNTSVSQEEVGYSFVNGENNFKAAIDILRAHCSDRISAVNAYL